MLDRWACPVANIHYWQTRQKTQTQLPTIHTQGLEKEMKKHGYQVNTSNPDITDEEALEMAEKLDAGVIDIPADEIEGRSGSPMSGEIRIKFNCKGGVQSATKGIINAGVYVTRDAKFGKWNEEEMHDMIQHPQSFLELGEVGGIAANLMELIFQDKGALSQAIANSETMRKEAEVVGRVIQIAETLGIDLPDMIKKGKDEDGKCPSCGENHDDVLAKIKPQGEC